MHPLIRGLFSPWDVRPEVIFSLGALAVLYGFGWWRVRQHSRRHKLATGWRIAAYVAAFSR